MLPPAAAAAAAATVAAASERVPQKQGSGPSADRMARGRERLDRLGP